MKTGLAIVTAWIALAAVLTLDAWALTHHWNSELATLAIFWANLAALPFPADLWR